MWRWNRHRNVAAALCLLLGKALGPHCFVSFRSFPSHHIATEQLRALQSLIIILGAYVALWVFYRHLVNPHTSPLRVEKNKLSVSGRTFWDVPVQVNLEASALGTPRWRGSAGREGLCLLFTQHCKREAWKMKGRVKVEHLSGLPGCREGDLPGRAAQQLQRMARVCLCSVGLEALGK